MSKEDITVLVTEKEIMSTPNDMILGEKIRQKFWKLKKGDKKNENNQKHKNG